MHIKKGKHGYTFVFTPAMSPQSPEEALIIGNVTVIKFVHLENVTENSQVDKYV